MAYGDIGYGRGDDAAEAYRVSGANVRPAKYCTNCGKNSQTGDKFCSECGTALTPIPRAENQCVCGTVFRKADKFCGTCGKKPGG